MENTIISQTLIYIYIYIQKYAYSITHHVEAQLFRPREVEVT